MKYFNMNQSIASSGPQVLGFASDLGFLSICDFCACSSASTWVSFGFLLVLSLVD